MSADIIMKTGILSYVENLSKNFLRSLFDLYYSDSIMKPNNII